MKCRRKCARHEVPARPMVGPNAAVGVRRHAREPCGASGRNGRPAARRDRQLVLGGINWSYGRRMVPTTPLDPVAARSRTRAAGHLPPGPPTTSTPSVTGFAEHRFDPPREPAPGTRSEGSVDPTSTVASDAAGPGRPTSVVTSTTSDPDRVTHVTFWGHCDRRHHVRDRRATDVDVVRRHPKCSRRRSFIPLGRAHARAGARIMRARATRG